MMVIIYKSLITSKFYIVQINEDDARATARIIGSYDSFGFTEFDDTIINAEKFVLTYNTLELSELNSKLIILIDSRPEHVWRVSSPRIHHFDSGKVLMVRDVDLKLFGISPEKKVLLTTSIESLQPKLQELIPCSDNPKLQIQNDKISENFKYLFSNGSVMEFQNIEVDCTDGGHPCRFQNNEDAVREKLEVSIECHEKLHGSISFYDKEIQLQAKSAQLLSGKMSSYCCFNSSHTISFYGDDCDNLQFMYLDRICNFSNYFMEGPCDRHGMQSKAQICPVFGLNCVLQRAYLMPCKETKPYEACLIDKFSCL